MSLNKERLMTRVLKFAVLALAGAAMLPGAAQAKDWQVKMLNRGTAGNFVFEPAYVAVKPGDTVTFVPVDKGHNAESVEGMLPTGAAPFKGQMSQQMTVKFTKLGLYGYECTPHAALGMVGLVQVGRPTNKAQVEASAARIPGLGNRRMGQLLAQAH
jgi:pseudoazurin